MKFNELFDVWIKAIIKKGYPGKNIMAYNFGIFEINGDSGYMLYLMGADRYDPDDIDWCAGVGEPLPKMVYLNLPSKEFKELAWQDVEDIIVAKVKEFAASEIFEKSFFNKAVAITVGFDDGDLIKIK